MMKAFNFQFEKLLRVRGFTENNAKEELGREISSLNEIEAQISQNRIEQQKAVEGRFSKHNSISEINLYANYIIRLDSELITLNKRRDEQNEKVEAAREKYIEASREKKIIEKLKEKQFKLYKKETQKTEGDLIDDLTAAKIYADVNKAK